MRQIDLAGSDSGLRAKRWDAVVVGGALPGLVAAIRLGLAGARVLIVEEETALRIPPLLREPFLAGGGESHGLLQTVLQALGVPLIDRRGFEAAEIAYQVIGRELRLDVGRTARCAEELVSWGLAKPELARDLVHALESAARAEAEAMLRAPIVHRGVVRGGDDRRSESVGRHARGLPSEVTDAEPALAAVLDVQVRAVTGAAGPPSPEARARLLGAPLAGSARPVAAGLRGLLRRRIEELHGEFRTVGSGFELVELDGLAGVAQRRARELWVGRSLILNAPFALLKSALESWEQRVPSFLGGAAPSRRRVGVQLRILREVLPAALAPRAILAEEPARPACLTVYPSDRGRNYAELVVTREAANDADPEPHYDALEDALLALFPFSKGKMARRGTCHRPRWDDELALPEPRPGVGWPGEVEIRVPVRPPVFGLAREGVFGLGAEGELLLGWRAGDTIASQLRGLGS